MGKHNEWREEAKNVSKHSETHFAKAHSGTAGAIREGRLWEWLLELPSNLQHAKNQNHGEAQK